MGTVGQEEKGLVQRLKDGEDEAFEVLIDAYGDKVLRLCYSVLSNLPSAEDITQQTFIEIYKSIRKFQNKSSLYTWIYKIAINKCRNEMRKNKDYCSMDDIEEVSSSIIVENEILSKLRDESITQCVYLLKPVYREVIVLYYYEGLSIKKICEILDEKENTVKSKLKRGRDLLKVVIEKEGNIL